MEKQRLRKADNKKKYREKLNKKNKTNAELVEYFKKHPPEHVEAFFKEKAVILIIFLFFLIVFKKTQSTFTLITGPCSTGGYPKTTETTRATTTTMGQLN